MAAWDAKHCDGDGVGGDMKQHYVWYKWLPNCDKPFKPLGAIQ
jgi:hypothetical protein